MENKKHYELIRRLTLIRIGKDITQNELSEKTGLTQQQISVLEKNKRSPKLSTLLKYCEGLGVELEINIPKKI